MSEVLPTGRELEALKVIWARGKATVREVYKELRPRDGELAYTTVLSLLQTIAPPRLVSECPPRIAPTQPFPARKRRRETVCPFTTIPKAARQSAKSG